MSTSKGSKIAMAVAGLILIAGTATAIAMTQKDDGATLPLFGTEDSSNATGAVNIPKIPAPDAEVGEAPVTSDPITDSQNQAKPQAQEDGSTVPGMDKLFNNDGAAKEDPLNEPAQKIE